MVAIFLLEDLAPVILGWPFITLHSQRYGMTVLTYFSKKTEEQVIDRFVKDEVEQAEKWKALSRIYQLTILATAIREYLLKIYPQLACLESEELKAFWTKLEAENPWEEKDWRLKDQVLVNADDVYCRTIFNIGQINGLDQAYVFE
jgi:hypothetical protein